MPEDLGAGPDLAADAAPRRSPSEVALDAIRPLANLPVFFKLDWAAGRAGRRFGGCGLEGRTVCGERRECRCFRARALAKADGRRRPPSANCRLSRRRLGAGRLARGGACLLRRRGP